MGNFATGVAIGAITLHWMFHDGTTHWDRLTLVVMSTFIFVTYWMMTDERKEK